MNNVLLAYVRTVRLCVLVKTFLRFESVLYYTAFKISINYFQNKMQSKYNLILCENIVICRLARNLRCVLGKIIDI